MVTARRFEDLGLTASSIDEVEQLTRRSRSLGEDEIADLAGGDGADGREAGREHCAG